MGFIFCFFFVFFFFKQKTAYEIVSGDWSADVCSSDLERRAPRGAAAAARRGTAARPGPGRPFRHAAPEPVRAPEGAAGGGPRLRAALGPAAHLPTGGGPARRGAGLAPSVRAVLARPAE